MEESPEQAPTNMGNGGWRPPVPDGANSRGSTSQPAMRDNPTYPHRWWEEMMRAEAERSAMGWYHTQPGPYVNPDLHHYFSGGPTNAAHRQSLGGLFQPAGGTVQSTTVGHGHHHKEPQRSPDTQLDESRVRGSTPPRPRDEPNSTQRRTSLQSLRDIMVEQLRQKDDGQKEEVDTPMAEESQPNKSYATAVGGATTKQPSQVQKKVLSGEEIRVRVAEILNTIPRPQEPAEPSRILKYKLSDEASEAFGRKTLELEALAVILCTGGINPLRDTVAKWVQDQVITKLKITVKQLRVLDRSHYLLTLGTEEERAKMLNTGPQYLNGRFVEIMPWTADYDTTTLTKKRKPAWVSIAGLSPSLEAEGRKILGKLGKVLHMSGVDQQGKNKFLDVMGMVLLGVDDIHPEAIEIEYEGGCAEFQLYYEFLPEGCYTCHETGHVARFCPKSQKTREVTQEELDEAIRAAEKAKQTEGDDEDVEVASPRSSSSTRTGSATTNTSATMNTPIPVANPYDILGEPDGDEVLQEEEEEQDDPVPTIRIQTQEQLSTQPELDLNQTATGEMQQQRSSIHTIEEEREEDTGVEEMDANSAQKRGTYGNIGHRDEQEQNEADGRSQGKKVRATVDLTATIDQASPEATPTKIASIDSQLGVIIGKHWSPVGGTPEAVSCNDSQQSDPEENDRQRPGKNPDGKTATSQSNGGAKAKGRRLKDEEEELVTDEDHILEQIHGFYTELYTREELPNDHLQQETAILSTLEKRLTEEENLQIATEPNQEEIKRIVDLLPKGKSPGIDGVTAEVIQESWE
ncbi:hypothetical protein R1sor_018212 [Riccia sorocarpa]|uniref:CCHC-type domain-containing protein n=1 Tax=Riccia sorocarpa TaxID=122646 RepID=A0ABD3ICS4_9MARC